MLQYLSLAVLLLAFGQITNAQLDFSGHCPQVTGMSEFDLDAYSGVWYEYSKYPFRFESDRKCNAARFVNLGNNTLSVTHFAVHLSTGTPSNTTGHANLLGPGRLALVITQRQSETEVNYRVLGTDYKSYALVYNCKDIDGLYHTRSVWILTRERKPSAEAVEAAKKIMYANKLTEKFLVDTLQDGCPNLEIENVLPSSDQNAINKV